MTIKSGGQTYNFISFGDRNLVNKLHGRGILLYPNGNIRIGYWIDGIPVTDSIVEFYKDGEIKYGV